MGRKYSKLYDRFSSYIAKVTSSSLTFLYAFIIVLLWAIAGPFFHFSNSWQLLINTVSSIITFLMVFIIQQAQNKDTMALQLKLNELIAATKGASNRVLNIEDMTEEELRVLKKFYTKLSSLSEKEESSGTSHSIDEAKKDEGFKEGGTGVNL